VCHRQILPTPIPGSRPVLPNVQGIRDKNGLVAKGNWVIDRTILHSRDFSPHQRLPAKSKGEGSGRLLGTFLKTDTAENIIRTYSNRNVSETKDAGIRRTADILREI
jgi:hypothetical protein